ncbi:TetR/AcrR family transcriptional regulator [Stackebrandtia nassauensis]|uniref:Transcriptional regulator, TetR family n=1 Tax=Stackebrandtia nassauensis (strain DSM 44728 / CIP 108903 / NRRL B-16338 / NBRC 102104 / LLR-40K-21) TaxID=446470 RepID=D3PX21_STANL|nr:TetR/AcrR family transcriptional regulator [Stackebrandtia nassauensis]ADD45245.1 transcriptional regulator, TetR family [Stackebrandtia nassauensis DSM 44728]
MESQRRRYESLVRTARADETRQRIAHAARELFVSHGWAHTTVREVARRAEVSVPTVYSAYGNKKGLALAVVDSMDLTADPSALVTELADSPPRQQLAAAIGFDCRLFQHSGDLIRLLREAARTEPELADIHRAGPRRGEEALLALVSSWPRGTLRDGLTPQLAVDTYAAVCTPDTYADLTGPRGWTPDDVQRLWTDLLTRELLAGA